MRAGVPIASALELEGGDPFGRYSTSDLQVRFSLATSPRVAEVEQSELVELATTALNHLIEHYRDVADKPLIRRVSAADIGHFTILYKRGEEHLQATTYGTGHGPLLGRSKDECDAMDLKVRDRLKRLDGPPLFRELELRTQQLFGERDYRGTVIEAAILFECWLKSFVRAQFALRGLTSDRIEAKLRTNKGKPRTANDVARSLLKEATGFDFVASNEFTVWRRQVADVRNDLVHGTRHNVTQSEAAACWDAVCKAMGRIVAAVNPAKPLTP
jgi:hypothetical protein